MSSTSPVNPFQGELWAGAQRFIEALPNGGQDGLSTDQMDTLIHEATVDGLTPEEQQLLEILADPSNVVDIRAGLTARQTFSPPSGRLEQLKAAVGYTTPFDPSQLAFDNESGRALRGRLHRAEAGERIDRSHVAMDEAGLSAAQSQARTTADATTIGPGQPLDLTARAGQDSIIDQLSQLAGQNSGPAACMVCSLLACAVDAGPSHVADLVRVVLADPAHADDARLQGLLTQLESGAPELTMGDLAYLQDQVFDVALKAEDAFADQQDALGNHADAQLARSARSQGALVDGALKHFLRQNPAINGLFGSGERFILAADVSGDGRADHAVVRFHRDGNPVIFDPWQTQSGHHLVQDPAMVSTYETASQDSRGRYQLIF